MNKHLDILKQTFINHWNSIGGFKWSRTSYNKRRYYYTYYIYDCLKDK